MRKFLRWLFGIQMQPTTQRKGIPWWCMDPEHQPYWSEANYDNHMLEAHGIDVRHSHRTKTVAPSGER